uniref:Uncharacterized protein n=1 Tax=Daphnia magna TaxID=35525 RepID=A0A0P6HFW4_9CRUS
MHLNQHNIPHSHIVYNTIFKKNYFRNHHEFTIETINNTKGNVYSNSRTRMSRSLLVICLVALVMTSIAEGTFLFRIPIMNRQYFHDKNIGFVRTSSYQPGRNSARKDISWMSSRRSYYYPAGPSGPVPPFEYSENFERPPVNIQNPRYGAAAPGFGGILFG